MKTISRVLAALILVATAGVASAQMKHKTPMESGYYGEVGYLPLRFSSEGSSATPDLARLVIGKDIDKNLSIEGMVAATVSKDQGLNANTYGVFAKPKMDVSKDTQIFARIGLTRTTLKGEGDMSAQTKVAYGIGAQTQINKDVYGQVDYINYMNKDGLSARGLTFSVGSRF